MLNVDPGTLERLPRIDSIPYQRKNHTATIDQGSVIHIELVQIGTFDRGETQDRYDDRNVAQDDNITRAGEAPERERSCDTETVSTRNK